MFDGIWKNEESQ